MIPHLHNVSDSAHHLFLTRTPSPSQFGNNWTSQPRIKTSKSVGQVKAAFMFLYVDFSKVFWCSDKKACATSSDCIFRSELQLPIFTTRSVALACMPQVMIDLIAKEFKRGIIDCPKNLKGFSSIKQDRFVYP